MPDPIDATLLSQRWIHVREEDTPTEHVFRPADFPLRPSRGRDGFEFSADGSFKRIGVGATDISNVTGGTWRIADVDARRVRIDTADASETLDVHELTQDRLTIKRP